MLRVLVSSILCVSAVSVQRADQAGTVTSGEDLDTSVTSGGDVDASDEDGGQRQAVTISEEDAKALGQMMPLVFQLANDLQRRSVSALCAIAWLAEHSQANGATAGLRGEQTQETPQTGTAEVGAVEEIDEEGRK